MKSEMSLDEYRAWLVQQQKQPTPRDDAEHREQAALFRWATLMEPRLPELATLFGIPNGGARHPVVAGKLKAEGVKSGVWDCFMATPRGGFHGLWLELKIKPNKLTPEQKIWTHLMRAAGYSCEDVCYDWTEAARAICGYLGVRPEEYGV